jgi:serine/threonine/tyrosine protein kinase RAD53
MDTPFSAIAPGEHDYVGETQGATQQASQNFYLSDVHPMDRPFFGCLQPCNSAMRRVDFLKTNPIITIGRGANNNIVLMGMRISADSFSSFLSPFPCS